MLKDFVKVGVPETVIDDYVLTGKSTYEEGFYREDKPWLPSIYVEFESQFTPYRNNLTEKSRKIYITIIEEYIDHIIKANDMTLLSIAERINDKIYWEVRSDKNTENVKTFLNYAYEMFNHITNNKSDYDYTIYTSVPRDIYVSFDDLALIREGMDFRISNYKKELYGISKLQPNILYKIYELLSDKEREEFYDAFVYGVKPEDRQNIVEKTIQLCKDRQEIHSKRFDIDFDL